MIVKVAAFQTSHKATRNFVMNRIDIYAADKSFACLRIADIFKAHGNGFIVLNGDKCAAVSAHKELHSLVTEIAGVVNIISDRSRATEFITDFFIDDICSRSFEKAFRQIRSYDPSKSQFSTWLTNIAHNTALDTVLQENRSHKHLVSIDQSASAGAAASTIGSDDDTPLESIIRDEDQVQTEKYIEGLPELYRRIARMRLVDGLQYSEIAEETGIPLNTVRTRIRRAKEQIDRMKSEESI